MSALAQAQPGLSIAPPNSSAGNSVRSYRASQPLASCHVVTIPPWAHDEPPSPVDDASESAQDPRPSDATSQHLTRTAAGSAPSQWSVFAPPTKPLPPPPLPLPPPSRRPVVKKSLSLRQRSMSWLSSTRRSHTREPLFTEKGANLQSSPIAEGAPDLPTPFAQGSSGLVRSPSAWNRSPPSGASRDSFLRGQVIELGSDDDGEHDVSVHPTPWGRTKHRLRAFVLSNTYIPLLFRLINTTFTTVALALAIRIRVLESSHHVMGAVGSSPTLVVIFAPLTLLHVMIAIYLEYFGRPLGLWRTSRKLMYTLIEVFFICAWSAALSLCFDNFFTSSIPCARHSQESWYNQLPPPPLPPESELPHAAGRKICEDQVALVCLVFLGLLMYCTNLVISLFRIFEKVKYSMPSKATGIR